MTRRRLVHALTIAALGAALGVGGGAAHLFVAPAPCTAATYGSHVTLVVEHGDGSVIGLCIGFDGSSITGEQILQASGVHYAVAGFGSLGDAVCQIDDEPTAYSSCLPSSGSYWVVFVSRGGGSWQPASSGISTLTLASGDAEGFRYDPQSGADPPPTSPAGICAAALAGTSATPSSGGGSGSASGAGSGSTSGGSSSPGSGSAQATPSVAPATGPAAPVAAVIGPVDGQRTSTATSTAGGAGVSPALLASAVILGALAGLAVVQLVMRRRRA
ncbi:MAG: hypothetical protein ABSB36_07200 [Candidatus Dormibacteria bacterium]|jgi:hypothetical protein